MGILDDPKIDVYTPAATSRPMDCAWRRHNASFGPNELVEMRPVATDTTSLASNAAAATFEQRIPAASTSPSVVVVLDVAPFRIFPVDDASSQIGSDAMLILMK